MLIQSFLPGSIESPLSFVSDQGKVDWSPGAENWQNSPKWEKNPLDGYEVVPIVNGKRNTDDLCSLNFASSCSQTSSTVSTMSENSTPAFVYQRRKRQRNSASVFPAQTSAMPSSGCLSSISSEAPSVVAKEGPIVSVIELESDVVGTPEIPSVECSGVVLISKSESINGCLVGEEPGSKEAPKSDIHRVLDFCCINDSYSSSKSNVELGSAFLRTEVDDTGECSSSGALAVESVQDDLSEKDICISILRSTGLLEGVLPNRFHTSTEGPGTSSGNSCIWTCKVCDFPETTLKMLICDQCEEAFHLSCCNTGVKKITVDEWFCHSCFKKKHKILKENSTSKARNTSSEVNRSRDATSEGELGPLASMVIDTEPYITGVRIGQDFQAEVPDWFGPVFDKVDAIGALAEIGPSESVSFHGPNSSMPSRLSSIGNWLQCREVIEGIGESVDGTICGKWRRAPLFEVQTDDWECFCAVLWDPAHADCAVPQELDTDEVLKQLKYIEMLRPRLAAKRQILDLPKNGSSQDLAEDARNMFVLYL